MIEGDDHDSDRKHDAAVAVRLVATVVTLEPLDMAS